MGAGLSFIPGGHTAANARALLRLASISAVAKCAGRCWNNGSRKYPQQKNNAALANGNLAPPHHMPKPRTAYAGTSTTGTCSSSP